MASRFPAVPDTARNLSGFKETMACSKCHSPLRLSVVQQVQPGAWWCRKCGRLVNWNKELRMGHPT